MKLTGTNKPTTSPPIQSLLKCYASTVRFPRDGQPPPPPTDPGGTGVSGHLHRVTAVIARGKRPVPFRTRKLSPSAPMVLHGRLCGRVGRRRTPIHERATPPGGGSSCIPGRCPFCPRRSSAIVPSRPDGAAVAVPRVSLRSQLYRHLEAESLGPGNSSTTSALRSPTAGSRCPAGDPVVRDVSRVAVGPQDGVRPAMWHTSHPDDACMQGTQSCRDCHAGPVTTESAVAPLGLARPSEAARAAPRSSTPLGSSSGRDGLDGVTVEAICAEVGVSARSLLQTTSRRRTTPCSGRAAEPADPLEPVPSTSCRPRSAAGTWVRRGRCSGSRRSSARVLGGLGTDHLTRADPPRGGRPSGVAGRVARGTATAGALSPTTDGSQAVPWGATAARRPAGSLGA